MQFTSEKFSGLRELMMRRAEAGSLGDLEPTAWDPAAWDAGCILPGLAVGSLRAALDGDHLKASGVTRILTVASRLSVKPPDGIAHKTIDIADHPSADILAVLEEALQFIDENMLSSISGTGTNSDSSTGETPVVLVHCASGVSRSVSVCCAWLMTRRGLTFEESLLQVRVNRPRASPNIGFRSQLMCLDETNGDIGAAIELYESRVGCSNIAELICEQREFANSIHAAVDALEVKIQSNRDKASLILHGARWMDELLLYKRQLDEYSASTNTNSPFCRLQDPPALMIRKSAAEKASRLIEEIKCMEKERIL
jgi:protein-tyrosine phosphatase